MCHRAAHRQNNGEVAVVKPALVPQGGWAGSGVHKAPAPGASRKVEKRDQELETVVGDSYYETAAIHTWLAVGAGKRVGAIMSPRPSVFEVLL
jgi:hypothetical protein